MIELKTNAKDCALDARELPLLSDAQANAHDALAVRILLQLTLDWHKSGNDCWRFVRYLAIFSQYVCAITANGARK